MINIPSRAESGLEAAALFVALLPADRAGLGDLVDVEEVVLAASTCGCTTR